MVAWLRNWSAGVRASINSGAIPSASAVGSGIVGSSQRRRFGVCALALVALLSVIRLRLSCDAWCSYTSEIVLETALLVWAYMIKSYDLHLHRYAAAVPRQRLANVVLAIAVVLCPWCLQIVLRQLGYGTGLELIMMSSLAWGTLLAALVGSTKRVLSTTVVCSGFLTLLVTCSSDHSTALLLALLWGGLCLWWLASEQWQRITLCEARDVVEPRLIRPTVVIAGCTVFALSAWSVAGRFPPAQRLGLELAPTSGGTSSQDDFARSGVGDGDAVVAAHEHAASFGAVDSDLFLDSDQPSLFDLYSDTFGEPFRKQETERAISLTPQETVENQPTEMSQSDGATSSLTTQRGPRQAQPPMENRASQALLFWIGRADTHLPMQRFAKFDGTTWTAPIVNAATTLTTDDSVNDSVNQIPNQAVEATLSQTRTWFTSRRAQRQLLDKDFSPFVGAVPEAIKVGRLRSKSIPTLSSMLSWHVDKVTDPTFFRLDPNDNLSMPARNAVPEYTIIRYINREIDLGQLHSQLQSSGFTAIGVPTEQSGPELAGNELAGTGQARRLAEQWTRRLLERGASRWEIVMSIIDHMRAEFHLDSEQDTSASAEPLAQFLQTGRGSDLMFATATAVMLEQLGFRSRLVTGFVARQAHRLGWGKEIAIQASDMHAWVELEVGAGGWVPLEPTPGYPLPRHYVSWRYWLACHATTLAIVISTLSALMAAAYWQRALLFDLFCRSLVWLAWLGNDRQRCRWLLRILDVRCRLAGHRRPGSVPPSRWYASLQKSDSPELARAAELYFREANQLWFGKSVTMSNDARRACRLLWSRANHRQLRQLTFVH